MTRAGIAMALVLAQTEIALAAGVAREAKLDDVVVGKGLAVAGMAFISYVFTRNISSVCGI